MLLTTVLLPDFFPGRLLKWLLYNETEVLVPGKGILWLISGQENPDSPLRLATLAKNPVSPLVTPTITKHSKIPCCPSSPFLEFNSKHQERRQRGSPVLATLPIPEKKKATS